MNSSFLENRTFDQRLVKENLIDRWNIYGDIYKTRNDYRQFLESYVIVILSIYFSFVVLDKFLLNKQSQDINIHIFHQFNII